MVVRPWAYMNMCDCVWACGYDTQLSLSDASLPWLQIKNTCTVPPQGAGQTAADWQRRRDRESKDEKRGSREGDERRGAKVRTWKMTGTDACKGERGKRR